MRAGGDNPHFVRMDVQFFTNEGRQPSPNPLTHFIGWAIKDDVVSRGQLKKSIGYEAVISQVDWQGPSEGAAGQLRGNE